ncbi:hypothetical protein H5410_060508 [Solanum commersonii]|uniref:Uncharacterized protein n=1 Tax=Solanum commersonii TaxID=4109 RepID=A0A9J5W6S0_SOLCO|nr:hypothetical protein H5410_060508 [Solanum commersonii]
MYFFIEFSIPWIMKWSVEIHKDLEGKIHGQEILDLINQTIGKYHNIGRLEIQGDDVSPSKQITRKLYMKKGILSTSEAKAIYMEEVKKDLIKNLYIDIGDDIFMASASHSNNDDEGYMAGEAQSDHSNDEIDIDALLAKFEEQVEESSNKATCKGKNKI